MYIKLNNEDFGKAMVCMTENKIKCECFDDVYNQFIKEEVEYFLDNIEPSSYNELSREEGNTINDLSNTDKELLIEQAVDDITINRDYLRESIDKEVELGIKLTLKKLFILAEDANVEN